MSFNLLDEPFTVRMDSWLPFDTFRRPGFGHVLRGREHVQILERGVNLVWLEPGRPRGAAGVRRERVCTEASVSNRLDDSGAGLPGAFATSDAGSRLHLEPITHESRITNHESRLPGPAEP